MIEQLFYIKEKVRPYHDSNLKPHEYYQFFYQISYYAETVRFKHLQEGKLIGFTHFFYFIVCHIRHAIQNYFQAMHFILTKR